MSTKRAVLIVKNCRALSNHQNYGNYQQYNNINLNKNYEIASSSKIVPSESNSLSVQSDTVDSINHNEYKTNKYVKNDPSKLNLQRNQNYLQQDDKIFKNKTQSKKIYVENLNKSTLSLHIEAYENSANEYRKGVDDNKISALTNPEQKDFFNFPRQQKEEEPMETELMAFRFSKPVLNCNGTKNERTFFGMKNVSSSTSLTKQEQQQIKDEEIKKHIQQTSEYFSQYIEEYYEEEEEQIEEKEIIQDEEPVEPIIKTDVSKITKDEMVSLLQEHRAQNIISIDVQEDKSPWATVIICSPYNDRHGHALMQTVRKHIKTLHSFEDDQMPRASKVTNGWFIFDMRNVLLHIMSESAREKYQLENLYSSTNEKAGDEEENAADLIPPPSIQTSSISSSMLLWTRAAGAAVVGRGNNRLLSLNGNHQIFFYKNFIRSYSSSMNLIRNAPDYIISAAAYYYAKTFHRGTNMSNLTALESIEQLSPSICRVLGQNPGPFTLQGTNTYLVGSGKSKILIDTGEPNIDEYITMLTEALGSDGKIEAIIITHWHGDHVGGIPNVIKLLGKDVPVYKFKRADNIPDTDHAYQYVEYDHEVKVDGATLQLLYSPGHTTDHMAILHKEENALFSGDCILGEGSAIFEDLHSYMNSLNKFLEIKPDKIYPGHGPVINDPQSKIEEYIKHRMQRENDIISVLSETSTMSSMDITNAVYKDIPFAVKLGALGNVKHHLTKLIKDERVIKSGNDSYLLKSDK